MNKSIDIHAFLQEVSVFRFLSHELRKKLAKKLVLKEYSPGDVIYRQGDAENDCCFLIYSGVVTLVESAKPDSPIQLKEFQYFGVQEALLRGDRKYTVSCKTRCLLYILKDADLIEVISRSKVFAQSIGAVMRDKQGVFSAFDRFRAGIMQALSREAIDLNELLPLYRNLRPVIHPGVNDEAIDFAALGYAIPRLPVNVTRCFAYLLTDELPAAYGNPDDLFPAIRSAARRRDIWQVMYGKNLVLIRSGLSDLLDFVTCMCLYAIEARKIGQKLRSRHYVVAIKNYLKSRKRGEITENERDFAARNLPFSEEELAALFSLWPVQTLDRLLELVLQREMFTIEVSRQKDSFHIRRTDMWTSYLGKAIKQLTGAFPVDLPDDYEIHIISSNTHSVSNCLNTRIQNQFADIQEWALEVKHPYLDEDWGNEVDLCYALVPDYYNAHPEARERRNENSLEGGIQLKETASTGIQVQLFDLSSLQGHPVDPNLPEINDRKKLIVNIDYAFGEQAQEIISNLLTLFGQRVRSVNFLGKAGAMQGRRGDILVPTGFVKQSSDTFEPINCCDTSSHLQESSWDVYKGPMLTVPGTLLQNTPMLNFYKHIWKTVGIEMEGYYYYKQVIDYQRLGITPWDCNMRFYYYVSDIPLASSSGENLSAPLKKSEGIPPLYGITREILAGIIQED